MVGTAGGCENMLLKYGQKDKNELITAAGTEQNTHIQTDSTRKINKKRNMVYFSNCMYEEIKETADSRHFMTGRNPPATFLKGELV